MKEIPFEYENHKMLIVLSWDPEEKILTLEDVLEHEVVSDDEIEDVRETLECCLAAGDPIHTIEGLVCRSES